MLSAPVGVRILACGLAWGRAPEKRHGAAFLAMPGEAHGKPALGNDGQSPAVLATWGLIHYRTRFELPPDKHKNSHHTRWRCPPGFSHSLTLAQPAALGNDGQSPALPAPTGAPFTPAGSSNLTGNEGNHKAVKWRPGRFSHSLTLAWGRAPGKGSCGAFSARPGEAHGRRLWVMTGEARLCSPHGRSFTTAPGSYPHFRRQIKGRAKTLPLIWRRKWDLNPRCPHRALLP